MENKIQIINDKIDYFQGNVIYYGDNRTIEFSEELPDTTVADQTFCLGDASQITKVSIMSPKYKTIKLAEGTTTPYRNCTSFHAKNLTRIEGSVFAGCTNLVDVDFPNVTSVGWHSFTGSGLENTNGLPKITSLIDSFSSSPNLKRVDFPKATSAGDWCFGSCPKLEIVHVPNLNSIGAKFVADDPLIKEIDFSDRADKTRIPTIDKSQNGNTFYAVSSSAKPISIIVPDEMYDDWSENADWKRNVDEGTIVIVKASERVTSTN